MYKRLIIVSIIIFTSLCGLCALGYYALGLHAEGLAARRASEFIAVAEQIRLDIKRKLDQFIAAEQNRPYTDYQYFYVPFAANDASALVRSPLAETFANGLAYGYFQIDADGTILSPYNRAHEMPQSPEMVGYLTNLNENVLTALSGSGSAIRPENVEEIAFNQQTSRARNTYEYRESAALHSIAKNNTAAEDESLAKASAAQTKASSAGLRRGEYRIPSLEDQQQAPQIITQSRANVFQNIEESAQQSRLSYDSSAEQTTRSATRYPPRSAESAASRVPQVQSSPQQAAPSTRDDQNAGGDSAGAVQRHKQAEARADLPPAGKAQSQPTIQIRIEPFRPIMVAGGNPDGILGGQVFLLRHVQIEQSHFIQGFRLNEDELVRQVAESAGRHVVRRDMHFDIGRTESSSAVHTAILDFGFGDLVLNLFDLNTQLVGNQIGNLQRGFFAVVGVVFVAVTLAQVSLWRTASSQIRLAKKKDDFISAVSHELRTPLTTLRMHTEMLEKGWIKNEAKRGEYYTAMRQETERLTRLIENVLDFSRIQRGRKKYHFTLGDVNACIGEVVEMMTPCGVQAGFTLERDFGDMPPLAFDADAVMQIVINLLDNAIKYARQADEKIIRIRTRCENGYAIIEVEDHGPGIPRLQRKKIFDEFYRCGDESKRETTGTGLGLALVKRFAQAHDGFVEVLTARPTGAIFRVALIAHTSPD
ncbi:MAG: HAMP domain-containing histidine kinase [Phycisphaerae bacterium]|nr:HAMP domain-containing histidine kinase [Phycisphaerae bacterium]